MKIALIPIDNRPVCYSLIKQIAEIDKNLQLFLPERTLLGGLKTVADIQGILEWVDNLEPVDALVVSLDTIAYGGLIPSRRSRDSLDEIKVRLEMFKDKFSQKGAKIYAFSSIMRISNNNINEEEKEYWDKYGTKIFEYSYTFHKQGFETIDIPNDILSDYLATRRRNFEINKMYLDWLEQGLFDTLVFSKDDCAEFGLNVLESEILKRKIKENNLSAFVKTGADEIPLTLFSKAVCDYKQKAPKIWTKFLAPEYTYLISKYEDISIARCVQSQIEFSGCEHMEFEEDSDLTLLVNNFEEQQGEIVMEVKTKPFAGNLELPKKPFMIADVRFANGADNKLIEKIFKRGLDLKNFYGYSGWNTSANTLGSLICAAAVRFLAEDYNEEAFKKLQLTRFLDDWAYQAVVRQILKEKFEAAEVKLKHNQKNLELTTASKNRPDFRKLKKAMSPYEGKLKRFFGIKSEIKYKFPWKRFFEVEVIIK